MNNKYGSRKFIIAILLLLSVVFLSWTAMHLLPLSDLVGAMPAILGFAGLVLGAIAVMYPVANAFQSSKWGKEE